MGNWGWGGDEMGCDGVGMRWGAEKEVWLGGIIVMEKWKNKVLGRRYDE